MNWAEIKQSGSKHYRTGDVEFLDLAKANGTLQDWAINEGVQHFLRNLKSLDTLKTMKCIEDMHKVIHYANMLICLAEEAKMGGMGKTQDTSSWRCLNTNPCDGGVMPSCDAR